MSRLARGNARKRAARVAFWLAFAGIGWLGFTVVRARRLLGNSRQIAAHSASFSRDYRVGNGPELVYLALGDSTAAGWGAPDLESTYPHQVALVLAKRGFRVHVRNVAVGGATLEQVWRDQSPFLQSVRPDFITLTVGANDTTHGTSHADYKRDLRKLLATLGQSSARAVAVANVPDMFRAPALPLPFALFCGRRARAFNALLNAVPQDAKLRIVDLFGQGQLDYQRDKSLYAADLFHPSGRGYAVWAPLFSASLANFDFAAPKKRPNSALTKVKPNGAPL